MQQLQFYRALCDVSGNKNLIDHCSIYNSKRISYCT
ncbi:hypothetical protein AADZ84_09595 [Colwelliaceae bacterium MEBiC 14330]